MTEKTELAVQEEPNERLLVPVASMDKLVEAMRRFEAIKTAMLVPDRDTYTIQGKERIRKSGWRKLALAFGISDEISDDTQVTDPTDKDHIVYHVRVRAWTRDGRTVQGVGSASSREREFAHLEHDLHALAHTRAKSRAIADMLGSSDLVAEELDEQEVPEVGRPIPDPLLSWQPSVPSSQPTPKTPTPTPPVSRPTRPSAPGVRRGAGAGVVWDFLDEVLGKELADLVTIEATDDEVLVKLDQELCRTHGDAFIKRMMKWGYGIHESPAGLVSAIKRPTTQARP